MAVTSVRRTQDPVSIGALPGFNVVAVAVLIVAIAIVTRGALADLVAELLDGARRTARRRDHERRDEP